MRVGSRAHWTVTERRSGGTAKERQDPGEAPRREASLLGEIPQEVLDLVWVEVPPSDGARCNPRGRSQRRRRCLSNLSAQLVAKGPLELAEPNVPIGIDVLHCG